jgi:SPOR domain
LPQADLGISLTLLTENPLCRAGWVRQTILHEVAPPSLWTSSDPGATLALLMNEIGPARPVLPRAAPLLAIGVGLALAGGIAVGWHLWHSGPISRPVAGPAETILLPAAPGSVASEPPIPVQPARPPLPEPSHPGPSSPPAQSEPTPRTAPAPVPSAAAPIATPAAPSPTVPPPPIQGPAPSQASSPPVSTPTAVRVRTKAASIHQQVRGRAPSSAPLPGHKPKPSPERWIVQFAIFRSDDHAKLLVDTLTFDRIASRIVIERDQKGVARYLVQSPPYRSKASAKAAAERALARGALPGAIVERQ